MRALGAVLAGGRSSRFGSDKAQALLQGVSLLDHAMAALASFCAEVVVCGHPHPSARVLADRPAPDMGPLGGLNAALHEGLAGGFDGVLVTGCDMPRFPPALAQALIGEGAAVLDGQPLAAWWPTALAEAMDKHLAETSKHSIYGWIERVKPRIVAMPDLVLPNINRPGDLDALVSALPSRPRPR